MNKIFKMAKAELSKIFMRPSMFVLTAVLVIALVFSYFFFNPEPTGLKYTYPATNTSKIYTDFQNDYLQLEGQLINAKNEIDTYISTSSSTYQEFVDKMTALKIYFDGDFYNIIDPIIQGSQQYLSDADKTNCKTVFSSLKARANEVCDLMTSKIKNKKINFFMTEKQYDNIYRTLSNFAGNLPNESDINGYTPKIVAERYNTLKSNYNIAEIDEIVTKLEKNVINNEELNKLLSTYFDVNFTTQNIGGELSYVHTGKLKDMYDDVINFYNENTDIADESIVAQMNEKVAKYYDYIQICKKLIINEFELLRIGNKTDDEIANYIGFAGTSIYNLKKEITTSKYYFDNNTFGYEYLTAFNFNKNSGTETNAYDFCFFSMQILSLFIIIFVIFFATSALSGEQTAGTLKMTVTRPFTRNKIYSGKFLACFNVAFILLLVSFISSFAVGIAMYGFSMQQVLVVINAETILIMNPILLMLIYFASILFDVIFYIALAIMISMLFKQTTVSTGLTSAIYIVSLVLFGTVTSSWIRFVPSLNLNLFRYFTNSIPGMFSFSVVPNTSLIFSACFAVGFTLLIDLFARFMFTHRSLDK